MEVKTESGGTFDAAGNGTKGLSIAGLVTGATALVGSGLLGMWANGRNPNNYNCHGKDFVTEDEFNMQKQFDVLNSELAKEKSERYADQAVIAGNERLYNFRRDIADAIVEDRQKIALIEGKLSCNEEISKLKEEIMLQKIDNVRNEAISAVALESERRVNGDQGLYGYVNATFVPGKLIMPTSNICPEVMPRYNSYTAPTSTTGN